MPLPVQNIITDCNQALDSGGSTFWDVNLDFVPAINRGQDYILQLIQPRLGAKKFNEENLKGIIKNRIYQSDIYSRIYVDGANITWGLVSVVVNPQVAIPPGVASTYIPLPLAANRSGYNADYITVPGSGKSCRRLNSQEFNSNTGNPFEAGYVSPNPNNPNVSYGYLSHVDFQSQYDATMPYGITISPAINPAIPVSITFINYPTRAVANGTLDWNVVFQQFITKSTLKFLCEKIGDPRQELYKMQEQDITDLLSLVG